MSRADGCGGASWHVLSGPDAGGGAGVLGGLDLPDLYGAVHVVPHEVCQHVRHGADGVYMCSSGLWWTLSSRVIGHWPEICLP